MFSLSSKKRSTTPYRRSFPRHPQEDARLARVLAHGFPETGSEPALDRIAREAASAARTPTAYLNVVRADDQISVGRYGPAPGPVSREESICAHTVAGGVLLVAPDLPRDPRFSGLPAVAAGGLRFYAGVPVSDGSGLPLGSLCLVDARPRSLDEDALRALIRFAELARGALDARLLLAGSMGERADLARLLESVEQGARGSALVAVRAVRCRLGAGCFMEEVLSGNAVRVVSELAPERYRELADRHGWRPAST